ncbi:RNA recognition motif domain-containing protein [Leptospira yasudae]|uniref:RNA recognition motif domain-containing protein n=1 Tax=Leptospira yasudae TaxID=2202201 RepID=UPI0010912D4C|nr:RNA-binding protein [Leptospira yasudae]TGM99263.1 RNA-binding protein [Leptospira yasudae]
MQIDSREGKIMKISVGNLPQELTEDELKKIFSEFGTVQEAHIKKDKTTGRSLSYGSVEMEDVAGAKAVAALNKKEIQGKQIAVVDSEELKKEFEKKQTLKGGGASSGKIHGNQSKGGFSGGATVRRTGGRGK